MFLYTNIYVDCKKKFKHLVRMRDECIFSDCQNSASIKAAIRHGLEIKFDCLLTFSIENTISYLTSY